MLISARREYVSQGYSSAVARNRIQFLEGNDKATSEYIFSNQKEDAHNIVELFRNLGCYAVSVQKKTKIGADGLMIELAMRLSTHIDDNFVTNPANIRIFTGMSCKPWETDMKDKAPEFLKDKIFHHGQLSKLNLRDISNCLFIIDEVDVGDKETQVLHTTLKDAGLLDVKHMKEHNNRFVFISATMIREQYDLFRWGELHEHYTMTIPDSYFGHADFLKKGLIQEFYPLNSKENADKWIQEDIIENYGNDWRVHIVRLQPGNRNVIVVQSACIDNGIAFRNHTSSERLSEEEINELFKEPLTQHVVLGVKGFFRRAVLIPNRWKLRIGATHELYTKVVDYNVQIQGLPGRMTGYWRDIIEAGHNTGPHRTSIKAIEAYEKICLDPFGTNSYQTSGFKMKNGIVSASATMLSAKNIQNMEAIDLPVVVDNDPIIAHPTPFKTIKKVKKFLKKVLDKHVNPTAFIDIDGYIISTRMNSYYGGRKKEELLATDILTIEQYNSIAVGLNISKTGNGQNYMVYPVYDDITTKDVSYYVRYYKLK